MPFMFVVQDIYSLMPTTIPKSMWQNRKNTLLGGQDNKNATAALQCGPFLVDAGAAVSGLNNTKSARRTFVLTTGSDRVAIGFSSSVTLAQMGEILATARLAPDLKVQRALNLDGGSSSAFWFAGERGVFSIPEQKTVRDFVAVVPK